MSGKDEFQIFPDLHFAITQLVESYGKEDRDFMDIKINENTLKAVFSDNTEELLKIEERLKLIKKREEQKIFSLEALSGALLQILKGKIYSRYESIKNCPSGRYIFSHLPEERPISVRDIILSGRIQYNHPEGITDNHAKKVFEDLYYNYNHGESVEPDTTFKLEDGKILAYNIMVLLNWTTYKGQFEQDMILLFDPDFSQTKRVILDNKKYLLNDRKRLLVYLRVFSFLKENMKKESTSEVVAAHDSIGVKAELAIKEIETELSSKKGNNQKQKEELRVLLEICNYNKFNPSIYDYSQY